MNANFYSFLEERFDHDDTFIESSAGNFSYADLDRTSASLASRFTAMGIEPGDRVLVQVEKSAMNLMAYFACLRAGFIYLPLNTAYLSHELEYFIGDAEPSLIICDPDRESLFSGVTKNATILTLDANGDGTLTENLVQQDFEDVTREPDDLAVILYTSGTTGQPKGAMITHGNLASNATTLHRAWGFEPDDVLLHALPIFHIHGLFVATHLAVMNSSKMLFLARFDVDEVIRMMPEATVYMGVPTNYTRLLADDRFDEHVTSNMRLFTSGSAPLLVQTFEEFEDRTGHTIVERYGMTETGMNTSNPLDGIRKPGTVGRPLPGVEAMILGDDGNPVEPGETGTLCIRGPNVFAGYWRKPDKTQEDFEDNGFFRTGDLATIDSDGYISIVGRGKDLIITGGLNVYPKEIETVIDAIPGVTESAVIGVPHADFGEAVTAVVVATEGAALDETSIIDTLKASIANFKVPKRVHFVAELPRNAMGKVQKNILRNQFS